MMRIRVVAFASASDILGAPEVALTVPAASTLSTLARTLEARFPKLKAAWPRLAIAVDGVLVQGDADPVLKENAEVALLPPVSGGSGDDERAATGRIQLVESAINTDALSRAVAGPDCGATVLFLGTVRDHHAGRTVARLDYSGYAPMAIAALQRIVDDLEHATPGLRVAIAHRLGLVPIGEPSVVIAAASPHRAAAYAASREALERLKREVPIWKREHYADGEVTWREEESLVARHPS